MEHDQLQSFFLEAERLEKRAKVNHVDRRIAERTPNLQPSFIPALESAANLQSLDPNKTYHAPLPGGGHAVLGVVGKPGRQKHVVKTVLAPRMRPPGTKLPPRHIFITGVPGSGKTTAGKKMSKELGLDLISLDGIPGRDGRQSTGEDARRFIKKNLDTPHIIEGTHLLGFRPKDLKGHQVYLTEQPRKVIVDRLVRRGWTDDNGKRLRGEKSRPRFEALHDEMADYAKQFKDEVDFQKLAAAKLLYAVGPAKKLDPQMREGKLTVQPGQQVFTSAAAKKRLASLKGGQGMYAVQVPVRSLKPSDAPGSFEITRGYHPAVSKRAPYKKTAPTPRGVGKIDRWRDQATSVGSTNLDAIKYNKNSKKLQVLFRSGALYEYDGISPRRAEVLSMARSKGKYFNENIRSKAYKYRRLE
jgi:adenylate kinase family enzyme